MNIPKVKFKKMSLEENINIVSWAFYADSSNLNIHDYTIQCFPKLNFISSDMSQNEANKIITEVVSEEYYQKEKKIEDEVERYSRLWKKYNDKYFKMLFDFFGCSFDNDVIATVGLIPVFPRNLDDLSFSISIDLEESKLVEVVAHETLHFIWFEKWKELYPKTPRRNYDSPYLEWKYSEMVTDPILNNRPFSDLFSFKEKGYDSFYELYDGDELVMDKLRKLYSTSDSINIKVENGFNYLQRINKK